MSFRPLVSRRRRWPWPLITAILCPAMAAYAAADGVNANAVEQRATRTETVPQLIDSARMWRNKYRNDLAMQMIDKALLLSPDNPNALAELGMIKIRSNRLDEASHILFRLRASNPKSEAARELGYAYMAVTTGKQELAEIFILSRKNDAGAMEAGRRLQLLFPDGPPKGDLAADYYTILSADPRRRPEALLALRHLLVEQPNNFSAALVLAVLLGTDSTTRMEGAKLAQRTVLNPNADRSTALNAWRRILRNAGADPAYIDLQKAYLQLVPDDGEFKSLLAASEQALAARQAALAAREKLAADPVWQIQQRGLKLLDKKELTPAELTQADALLKQAFASRSTDPELLGGLGRLRADQGRQMEARAFFLEAARLDPANRTGWENRARTAFFWGQISAGNSAIDQGHPELAESAAQSALALQPTNPYARQLLAESWMAQHRFAEAEPILRQLLDDPEVGLSALRNLITVLHETKRPLEIEALMDAMQNRFKGADQAAFLDLRANQLSDDANPLLEQGKNGPAIEKLEQSIRLAPDQAWIRFKLARLYQRLGLPQLGTEVMEQGLAASKAADMYYATTLYRNSIDDLPGAVEAINHIPEAQRSDSMRSLANNLHAQQLLLQARGQAARGEKKASEESLTAAAALTPDDADMLASLGRQWIAEGDPDQGLQLVQNWLTAHPDDPAPDVRLRYGDLLANAGREAALTTWLEEIRQMPNLTPPQSARLEDQSLRLAFRLSDAAVAAGDNTKAEAILAAVSPAGKADKRWSLALADLRRTQGRYAEARAAVAPVLAKTPSDFDARLTLARIEEDSKQPEQALALVRQVVQEVPPEDLDTRLSTARRLTALQQPLEASDVVAALKVQFPNDPDVTVQDGRVLQSMGLYASAKTSYQLALSQEAAANVLPGTYGTPAQVALFNLEQRGQPMIETAFIPTYKSGTAGVSSLKGQTVPVYVRIPQGYDGHWFLHADTVRVDAGALNPNNPGASFSDASGVGTFAAYPSATTFSRTPGAADVLLQGPLNQNATGVALGFGYETDVWRADVGTTPIGFPVQNLVGGFRYRVPNQIGSLSLNLSRRPMTSSLLSYAGMHDPVSNQVYGGVVRTGIDAYASKDIGKNTLFLGMGAGVFTGRNVETNQGETVRTGIEIPLFTSLNWRLESGLVGSYEHYAKNLRFYTFGQGGYYSPQRYLSLSVPIDWTARYGKASWGIHTSLGFSHTGEADSPFFPTDATLQNSALANSVNNVNTGSAGGGFSYSFGAIFQYAITQNLAGGLNISIDRSRSYAPSTAMVYLRYLFNPGRDPVKYPSAVTPYSDF